MSLLNVDRLTQVFAFNGIACGSPMFSLGTTTKSGEVSKRLKIYLKASETVCNNQDLRSQYPPGEKEGLEQ